MNNDEGVKEYLRRRLLEAAGTDDLRRVKEELKAEGQKPGSIDAVIHELRQRGHLQFGGGKGMSSKSVVLRDLSPAIRSFIDEVYVPRPKDGQDGYWDGYEEGTRRARQDIVLAMWGLQQLSALGIQQAQPLVAMAKELRTEPNPYEIGAAVAEALGPAFSELKSGMVASSPNPLATMFFSSLAPFIKGLMGQALGAFMPGGQGQALPGQPSGQQNIPKPEIEEVFRGF